MAGKNRMIEPNWTDSQFLGKGELMRRRQIQLTAANIAVLLLILATIAAAGESAPKTVSRGDHVLLHYTCRLSNGQVAATTEKELALDRTVAKADIFNFDPSSGEMPITAGESFDCPNCQKYTELKSFDQAIKDQLSAAVVGQAVGQRVSLAIDEQPQMDLPEMERRIQLAWKRRHPKKVQVLKEQFFNQWATEPVLGNTIELRSVVGKVVRVTDNEATVEFQPRSNKPISGPFGPIRVQDQGKYYEIFVDVEIGRLIRTGPVVGKIVEIDGDLFTLDYAHPFGYETLTCVVLVKPDPQMSAKK
jgi:FKBP-type peptidyl-prolyl cis-trans isomerase 2